MTIHYDLTFAGYQSLPGWNWSRIKLLRESPLACKHGGYESDSSAMVKLRAIHALVLEPDNFDRDFSVYDGVRNASHKAYQEHLDAHPDTDVLNISDYNAAQRTADAIKAHPVVRELMKSGRGEVSLTWTHPETGLPCKGRIDWLGAGVAFDLKTLGTVHEREVARRVASYGYHGQAAHYLEGVTENGLPSVPFFLVVAEGNGAQDVAVYELDKGIPDGALYVGRKMRRELMRTLAECVERDEWPGRHTKVQTLSLPPWALDESDTDIIIGGE